MPHVTVTLKHTPKPDAVYVVAHAAEKTSGTVEQCGSCHGEKGAESIRKWHAVP